MRSFKTCVVVALLAALLLTTGCLGPNYATGHLAKWNREVDGKWGNEAVFFVCLPVYVLFSVSDILFFNSWQWWTGTNLLSPPSGDTNPVTG